MKRKLKTLTEQFTDARTNYNRILGRDDKQLMTEQGGSVCQMSLKTCQCYPGFGYGPCGTGTSGGMNYPQVNGACPSKGDVIEVTGWNTNGPVKAFVRMVNTVTGYGGSRTWTPLPSSTSCDACCSNWGGYGGGSGACWVNCGNTPPCDTTPNSPCAQQWFQNPNATWASTWINNRDCSNYTWPSTNLETQALSIMASAPNPQPNVYNDWNDIWGGADTAFPNITGPPKNTFIAKMAKAKYSQCQKQACNC